MKIKTGKGILEQINTVYEFPTKITKAEVKEFALSLKDDDYCKLWKETFGESYEDYIEEIFK